jgi:hypothetical protein
MVKLFGWNQSVPSRHLRNVFADGELSPEGNMQKMYIASAEPPPYLFGYQRVIESDIFGLRFSSAAKGRQTFDVRWLVPIQECLNPPPTRDEVMRQVGQSDLAVHDQQGDAVMYHGRELVGRVANALIVTEGDAPVFTE